MIQELLIKLLPTFAGWDRGRETIAELHRQRTESERATERLRTGNFVEDLMNPPDDERTSARST